MTLLRLLVALFCAAAAAAHGVVAAESDGDGKHGDLITSLPGLEKMPDFKMYSGYVTVDKDHGRALFYFFAESQNDPSTDPIILWQQGGPGCSSLVGMMTENGPLRAKVGKKGGVAIDINGWSWNRFANVLYVDAPAGVGFSYSNTSSDYNTNDTKTAIDNYAFLQGWFDKFPQFANQSIWLTGESYGGNYVPQLAQQIITGKDKSLSSRLKGFAVGNPVFSCDAWKATQGNIQANLYYWHGLIPLSIYNEWEQTGCARPYPPSDCDAIMKRMTEMVGDNFDPDNLFSDLSLGNATLGVGPVVPPNETVYALRNTWLNQKDVQAALHVHDDKRKWVTCCAEPGQSGGHCQLNYTNHWADILPLYRLFFDKRPDLRILVYSGDLDIATCPFAYAQLCLSELGYTATRQWQPWRVPGGANQTAGYVEVYPRFTYATVKGAGHEVPQFQPAAAFHMVSKFINASFP
ncbi:serine carboxypeptidase II [Salpingoeca rosetta]|uniref:Carboxypeptidase n=1 Tax=Salpingoeca rosetta (strain ATCC 50818 / BSB-021) TaxID=946362 RepID=F2U2V1_SALR5|nr:serine carboxypeptidase II [Salpingoeca rosetta]EGD81945.1 serine carboxypeptidase II [Salpingoeca rosetta]|eukprot:XP_004996128.1 serine carboxypeptidase II [Salpingoeca rosetta]